MFQGNRIQSRNLSLLRSVRRAAVTTCSSSTRTLSTVLLLERGETADSTLKQIQREASVYKADTAPMSSENSHPATRSEAPTIPQVQLENRAHCLGLQCGQNYGRDCTVKETFVMSSATSWAAYTGQSRSRARNFSHLAGCLSETSGSAATSALWKEGDPIIFASQKPPLASADETMASESARSESAEGSDYMFSDSENSISAFKSTTTERKTVATIHGLGEGSVAGMLADGASERDFEMSSLFADEDPDYFMNDLPVRKPFTEAVQSDILPFETMGTEVKDFNRLLNVSKIKKQRDAQLTGPQSPPNSTDDAETSGEVKDFEYTPCTYEIPAKVFNGILSLKDGSPNKFWSHKLYRGEDGKKKLEVHYCKTLDEFEQAASLFLKDTVLGFDMEWVPYVPPTLLKKNVSLIQIANKTDIALFHVALVKAYAYTKRPDKGSFPPTLKSLLESETILKTGVNIRSDITRLRNYFNVKPAGIFELCDLHHLLHAKDPEQISKRQVALSALAAQYLLLPLDKGPTRMSNWSRELSISQQTYAATDAYAAVRIFDELEKRRRARNPRPKFPLCEDETKTKRKVTTKTTKTNERTAPQRQKTARSKAITRPTEVTDGVVELGEAPEKPLKVEKEKRARKPKKSRLEKELDKMGPEMGRAHLWAREYCEQRGDACKATVAQIRAYALWHNGGYEVEEIAKFLRTPPLKTGTVISYIIEAIRLERLEHDKERMREIMPLVTPMIGHNSWKFFMSARGKRQ